MHLRIIRWLSALVGLSLLITVAFVPGQARAQTFSGQALEDLDERGLLDNTLVYWTGDFGRTPKINKDAGRDHWPPCQTVLMAGGGIRGGQVYGASDPSGGYPKDNPVRPDDITASVFHALGFDPETVIQDQLGRPMPIAAGQPI